MSIKLITLVWDKMPASGSELLCMLAMADWASDDGSNVHPSMLTLAKKMRVSESQARRVLHKLISDGLVSVVGNAEGGAPGATRRYKINVSILSSMPDVSETGSADARGCVDATGRMDARDGSHGCAETGSAGASLSVSRTVREPSKDKVAKFDPLTIDLPSCIPVEAWARWVSFRRNIRKSLNEDTAKAQIKRLSTWASIGHSAEKIIDESIAHGWQGLFEPKRQAMGKNRSAMNAIGVDDQIPEGFRGG